MSSVSVWMGVRLISDKDKQWFEEALYSIYPQVSVKEICISWEGDVEPEVSRAPNDIVIKKVKVDVNEGGKNRVAVGANKALRMCTGDYVIRLDHDNKFVQHAIDKLMTNVDGIDIIFGERQRMDENGKLIERVELYPSFSPERLALHNFIESNAVLVKREVYERLGYFDEDVWLEDWDLWLRAFATNNKFRKVNFPVVISRMYGESVTGKGPPEDMPIVGDMIYELRKVTGVECPTLLLQEIPKVIRAKDILVVDCRCMISEVIMQLENDKTIKKVKIINLGDWGNVLSKIISGEYKDVMVDSIVS